LYFSWLKYRMGKKKLSSSAFKSKYFWRIPLNFSSQSTFVRDAPCLKKLWLQGLCWVLKYVVMCIGKEDWLLFLVYFSCYLKTCPKFWKIGEWAETFTLRRIYYSWACAEGGNH
jgi:hypothetical protein